MLTSAFRNAIAPTRAMTWTEATLVSAVSIAASLPLIAGLYLVKSAMGINLMAGPSPLHDLLYQFVR